MRAPQHLSVLASSHLAVSLDEPAKTELLATAMEKRVPRGRVLFRQGDPAEVMYVVLEGTFKLTQEDHHGHEALVRFLGPGAVMAAVALVPGHSYPVTARALEPAVVALWHQGELVRLCRRYPALHFQATAQIAAHMREMQERFLELASERVEQRLARCLVRLVSQVGKKTDQGVLLDVPVTRQDLAAMTGTTLYTVSRILSHWREMGLLHPGRRLIIKSPHGLMTLAEDLPEGGKL
ncbi:MAG: Crp/Fnr family transcriptional regulator [Thermoanaerobaculaceae bacterium]